ncbi:Coleoptile phototropism protein 1 [Linum grandiflorum]
MEAVLHQSMARSRTSVSSSRRRWISLPKHSREDATLGKKLALSVRVLRELCSLGIVRTTEVVEPDLIIQVGDSCFHVHKLAMVSRSTYLNRLVFQNRTNSILRIHLQDLPGGAESFELIMKFCYGWKINLTPTNIAAVYSAANFLEMNNAILEDQQEQEQGRSLISTAETFLTYLLMLSSRRDLFSIFVSCESVPYWAEELQILNRCSKALASRVCLEIKECENGDLVVNRWLEEVASLRMDHFVRVVESMKREGMKLEIVSSFVEHWFLKGSHRLENLTLETLKAAIEGLIRLLPEQATSISCNILLQLLKLGTSVRADSELLARVEAKAVRKLESCRIQDLMVRNSTGVGALYDVDVVARVVRAYIACVSSNYPTSRLRNVGKLVDEYLCLVSRDTKLSIKDFISLVDALPEVARRCHDCLYRAIDLYLKVHPWLTDEERTELCKAMDYHKLSKEAQSHATKNERLSLLMSTRIIMLEQVNMTRSMTCSSRTNSQPITLRITNNNGSRLENGYTFSPRNEIRMMKKEVESMKMQINELQVCRLKMQLQLKRCLV